ncbi:hypothetical protein EVJ27_11800 [Exiguobacterium sp. SH3S2]|nr:MULTISPECIES: hypothetical protein [unclassified Exiguobacterium]TCI42921.1 hypothetical protein EVJ28_11820 [Exiguobacterium sp. SH3S3]TCI56150.1 hypothetical protein EVJ30_04485 [Exiguobacterium sp. SH5S13]TCI58674.1 hypothetical protein EVJ27_11800 [Exiguobacterium sp. SH3S2]TCI61732.1 hypothetical protein EVJ26_09220 [Exiguobacterium sp. SH3S1]
MALDYRTDEERAEDRWTTALFMWTLNGFIFGMLYGVVYRDVAVVFLSCFLLVFGIKGVFRRDDRIKRERAIREMGIELDSKEGEMLMKREYATYEVTGYDDKGKIKFIHLKEGEFVLPVEIKGDDLTKIKKMMELNPGVIVIVHAAIDQKRMRLLEIDGYSLRKEEK